MPVRVRPIRRNYLAERAHAFRLFTKAAPQHEKEVTATLREAPPVSRERRKKLAVWAGVAALLVFGLVIVPLRSDPGTGTSGAEQSAVATLPAEQSTAAPPPSAQPAPPASTVPSADRLIAVVRGFYDAVNARDYRKAWDLLGERKLGIDSFEAFQAGYAQTDHVELQILGVHGSTVDCKLVADENGAPRRAVYQGCYRIENGRIVAGKQDRV